MALASVVDGLDCPPQTRSPKCSECYLPYFQSHDDRCHCTGHGSLPKFTSTLAPFAPPASGATRFPDFIAHIGPSDFHTLIGLGSGSPRLRPTSRRVASDATHLATCGCSSRRTRVATRAPFGGLAFGSPSTATTLGKVWTSQVTGSSFVYVPKSNYPAGCDSLSPCRGSHCCLRGQQTVGHPR